MIASSSRFADPVGRPGAVVDGDLATAWAPAASEGNPLLRMTWSQPRAISGLRLRLNARAAATRLGAVQVIGDEGVRGGFLNDDGIVRFDEPLMTDAITILLYGQPSAYSYDPYSGWLEALPIAVGEITVLPDGPSSPIDQESKVDLACGSGPTIRVGAATLQTRISATVSDLLQMREIKAEPCDDGVRLSLSAGETRVVAAGSSLALPTRLSLVPDVPTVSPTPTIIRVDEWSATQRRLHLDPHAVDRVMAVRENANAGWQASASGQVLTPLVVDGWQQGWIVPAGVSGEIVLRFRPDASYRAALAAGGVLLLAIVLIALVPARRRGSHAPRPAGVHAKGDASALLLVVGAPALVVIGGALGVSSPSLQSWPWPTAHYLTNGRAQSIVGFTGSYVRWSPGFQAASCSSPARFR